MVGIVANVHESGLAQSIHPELYLPDRVQPLQTADLLVRTAGEPLQFLNAIRRQVLAIDREQPISNVKTMDEVMESSVGQQRLTLLLLGSFAGVALLLALVGIYGTIAYSVMQRTREFGIRRALGAQTGDILRSVVGRGLALTSAGMALGVLGALALTRLMNSLLFRVSATDPMAFGGAALLFLLVALAASYIPARRAARIDPMRALR